MELFQFFLKKTFRLHCYIERDGNTQNYDLLGDTKVQIMHPFKKMILSKTHQNVSAGLSPIVFSEFTSYTVVPGQTQETSIYATFTINSGTHTFRGRAISYGSGLTISTTVIINGVTGLNLDNATSTPQNSSASITLSTPGTQEQLQCG